MSTLLTELHQYVMPELPKCSAIMINQSIIEVVRDFCNRTLQWDNEHDDPVTINVRDGKDVYDVDKPDPQADIVVFKKVERRYEDDGTLVELSPDSDYTRPELYLIKLEVVPDADVTNGLELTVALRPTRTCDRVPDCLFDEFYSTWALGVKARLMKMPTQPWTNLVLGQEYEDQYFRGVNAAMTDELRGHTLRSPCARPRWKFA